VILTLITPLLDAALIFLGFFFLQSIWGIQKFGTASYYPAEYLAVVVPVYIMMWMLSVYLSGGYEKKVSAVDLLKGIATGTIGIMLIYALLPENMRYSRALLLFGSVWALLSFYLNRITQGNMLNTVQVSFRKKKKRIVIAGSQAESQRVLSILNQVNISPVLAGLVNWQNSWSGEDYIGDLDQLNDIVPVNRIDEIIFCARDIPSQDIIQTMLRMGEISVEFKIAPPESLSVIGSNSINTAGELYVVNTNTLSHGFVKRKKRVLDLLVSFLLLLISPIAVFFTRHPLGYFGNIFSVLLNSKTWVGVDAGNEPIIDLKPGILSPIPASKNKSLSNETIRRLNLLYAKDYKIITDLSIIIRDFKFLGG